MEQLNMLCGYFTLVSHKSAKSKRVAISALAAELLSAILALEEATFIQTWLYEMQYPASSTADILRLSGKDLIPITHCMDCYDLFDLLTKAGAPNSTKKSLVLHLSVAREHKDESRVRDWVWIDTRDMLANCLAKLCKDGRLESETPTEALKTLWWNPTPSYNINGQRSVRFIGEDDDDYNGDNNDNNDANANRYGDVNSFQFQ